MNKEKLKLANSLHHDIEFLENQLGQWRTFITSQMNLCGVLGDSVVSLDNAFDEKIFETFRDAVINDYRMKLKILENSFNAL